SCGATGLAEQGLGSRRAIAPVRARWSRYGADRIKTRGCPLANQAKGNDPHGVAGSWRKAQGGARPHPKFFEKVTEGGRSVSESSAAGDRAVRGRDEPDPGAGSHATGLAFN